ncbi:MAG: hypothetical protein BWY71_01990 [Planctomycetes bacterium ADurb.Bin412]|nr:MAG: hypothetical protein BWY71_01990 [Planctomycetes bacterium ADurb.Bin412]
MDHGQVGGGIEEFIDGGEGAAVGKDDFDFGGVRHNMIVCNEIAAFVDDAAAADAALFEFGGEGGGLDIFINPYIYERWDYTFDGAAIDGVELIGEGFLFGGEGAGIVSCLRKGS